MTKAVAQLLETTAANRFSESVTAVAFHLTLSKNMITALGWLRAGQPFESVGLCQLGSLSALENRGLVIWMIEKNEKTGCQLTKAGRLTCELLVVAGLLPRIPAGKPRKKARNG